MYLTSITVSRRFSLGPDVRRSLTARQEDHLVTFYSNSTPDARVIARTASTLDDSPNFVSGSARFHSHIILDGRRIIPSTSLHKASASIVQADFSGTRYVGQVTEILTHQQPRVGERTTLLNVRWFRRHRKIDTTPWDA